MSQLPNDWKQYPANRLFPYADHIYQKLFYIKGTDEKIGFELVAYKPMPPHTLEWGHELHTQIPDKYSITGMTINVNNFSFRTKHIDWKDVEDKAKKIISALLKKGYEIA